MAARFLFINSMNAKNKQSMISPPKETRGFVGNDEKRRDELPR